MEASSLDSEKYFQFSAKDRGLFINDIVNMLPTAQRSSAREKIKEMVEKWVGWDGDAMAILHYAAKKGKFQEYFKKLSEQHEKDLSRVPLDPQYRRNLVVPAIARTYDLVMACYKELGIKPRK